MRLVALPALALCLPGGCAIPRPASLPSMSAPVRSRAVMLLDTAAVDVLSAVGAKSALVATPTATLAAGSAKSMVLAALSGVNLGIVGLFAFTSLFAAVFGFGDAILAMPLLSLFFHLDVTAAAPLVTAVSSVLVTANLVTDLLDGQMRATGRWVESLTLFAAALVGVPLGVRALVSLDPHLVRGVVGVLLVGYGGWKLRRPDCARPDADFCELPSLELVGEERAQGGGARPAAELRTLPFAKTALFGLCAGLLGGAVAEPGPPAVVFGTLREWSPAEQRTMLSRFFLPVQALAMYNFAAAGLLTSNLLSQSLAAVPGVLVASVAGTWINRRVDPGRFAGAVTALVIVLGGVSITAAIGGAL